MKPSISIVITTHNSGSTLERLLSSISKKKCTDVIVVDSSKNNTCQKIVSKFGFQFFSVAGERSVKRNFGLHKSTGSHCFFADSDMIFTNQLLDELNSLIAQKQELKALFVREKSIGNGFWTKCKILERDSICDERYLSVARFVRRDIALEIGGFDERNTGTEDYDFQTKLEQFVDKSEINFSVEKILHDEKQIKILNHLTKKFFYSSSITRYLKTGNRPLFVRQLNIAHRFFLIIKEGHSQKVTPVLICGALALKTLEFTFGALGYIFSPMSKKLSDFVYRSPK